MGHELFLSQLEEAALSNSALPSGLRGLHSTDMACLKNCMVCHEAQIREVSTELDEALGGCLT